MELLQPRPRQLLATVILAPVTALVLSGCAGPFNTDPLGLKETGGTVCAPVDKDGVAGFSTQILTNTTNGDLTITDVTAEEPLTVTGWFLAPLNWEGSAAQSGPFVDRSDDFADNVLRPGEEVFLAVDVQSSPDTPVPPTSVIVNFERGLGESTRRAPVLLATAPYGEACV